MLDRFYFNRKKCFSDLKVLVKSAINFPLSNEEVEEIIVEGRNGTLTINKGTYLDKRITVDIAVLATTDFWDRLEQVEEWLTNIEDNRLIFADRPSKAYRVKRVIKNNMEQNLMLYGSANIEFVCEPFLTEIDEQIIDITNLSNYYYIGNVEGEPFIKIYGSGNIQLTINNENVTIKNISDYVILDSKYMVCKNSDGSNKSLDMLGDYPLLIPGNNTISKVGNITNIEMLPRIQYRN